MGKLYLKARAELNNVTDLQPVDTTSDPFEYTFKIQCISCREVHDKPITVNRFDHQGITGSRGEASFVFRCRQCKNEHSASILRTKEKITTELSDKLVPILEIDARGLDFVEFFPYGRFECSATESTSKFDEVDLSEGEWYEYDDKAGTEVSVENVHWAISR
ncbi:uncharacterized protein PRCAT00005444001 [Priceomyces carsonii]|uniref:uncharacterized protein n=1 Tax=Priceomyces carsonii TaxID=28549 RepID=UPI002ED7D659|nr:unnamed protein product [Priceomyces carsonii]